MILLLSGSLAGPHAPSPWQISCHPFNRLSCFNPAGWPPRILGHPQLHVPEQIQKSFQISFSLWNKLLNVELIWIWAADRMTRSLSPDLSVWTSTWPAADYLFIFYYWTPEGFLLWLTHCLWSALITDLRSWWFGSSGDFLVWNCRNGGCKERWVRNFTERLSGHHESA